ncbi:hypothetical protein Tco_1331928 [Tanacetum coccineum]
MLGIHVGGTLLKSLEETEGDLLTDWLAQFGDLDPKKIRATHIAKQIVKATNIDFMFKMNFLVLVTNTLAKNETKNEHVSLDVLKRVREGTPVQSIDWCGYILDSRTRSVFSNTLENIKGNMSIFCFILCQCQCCKYRSAVDPL